MHYALVLVVVIGCTTSNRVSPASSKQEDLAGTGTNRRALPADSSGPVSQNDYGAPVDDAGALGDATNAERTCQQSPSTAAEIVGCMKVAYRSLASYRDTGVAIADGLGWPSPFRIAFQTSFVMPSKFRFEVTHDVPNPHQEFGPPITRTATVWLNNGKAHRHRSVQKKIENLEDLEHGLFGITGHSLGVARYVPFWLLGFDDARPLDSLSLTGSETIGTITCYHIVGRGIELWVGESDLLLRKISIGRSSTRVEILYSDVEIDQPIPESVFDYVQPFGLR